jgi:hypothetical protein
MPTVAEAPPPLSPYGPIRANLRDLYLSDTELTHLTPA